MPHTSRWKASSSSSELRNSTQVAATRNVGKLLRSARSARWMKDKLPGTIIPDTIVERMERAADPLAEGRRICTELVTELGAIPGVAGAHIMAPNNNEALPEVLAGLAHLRRATV